MRARVAASVVLVAGLLLGSTGCTFFSPQTTLVPYDASDGVSVTIGDVAVRNALIVSNDGVDGNVVMVVVNSGDTTATVHFQYNFQGGSANAVTRAIEIPAGGVISFGNPGTPQLQFPGIGVKPGGLLPVFVQYGSEQGKVFTVPVLDSTFSAYSTLTPTPTPTPVPTGVPSATATPTTK